MSGLFALCYGLLYGAATIGNGIKHAQHDSEAKQEAIREGRDFYLDYKGRTIDIKSGHHYTKMYVNNDWCICDADNGYKVVRNLDKERRDKSEANTKQYAKEEGEKRYYRLDGRKIEWIRYSKDSKYHTWKIPSLNGLEWSIFGDLNNPNKYYYERPIFNSYYMIDIDTGLIQKEQRANVKVYKVPMKGHDTECVYMLDNHSNKYYYNTFDNIEDLIQALEEMCPKYQKEFGKPYYL